MEPAFATRISEFSASLDGAIGEPRIVEAAKLRLVDTVGCMLGAASAEPVQAALGVACTYARPAAGVPSASVVGARHRLPLESAGFINGVAARYLDYNDIYLSKEAVHPSDNVACAIAAAEGLQRDGRALLLAIIRGYEVHCRLADTVSTRKGGWDNVILGAIASSVMTGSLLNLSVEQQAQAIAITAVANVALMETRVGALSMWKAAAAAYAAKAGMFAALHAAGGFTGPLRALDGKHGMFARVTGPSDPAAFAPADGTYRTFEVHLKAFPAQYFTQTAIEAALRLRQSIGGNQVRKIYVRTFEFGRVAAADSPDKWKPRTRETADHSMPYCIAVALLDGAVGEAQFELERVLRADVQALMQLIDVAEDPALNPLYPEKVPTRIAIELADGRRLEEAVDYPLGHSRNPMSVEQVARKFEDLAGPAGAALFPELMRIETLGSGETAALLGGLFAQTAREKAI